MEVPSNYDTSWSSATNWAVAGGSLSKSLIFESSFTPVIDGADESSIDPTPVSPLILYPSSPDSRPCEIKITFAQKHEVRQIYIRSTARVYEVYYAPGPQSTNEYLCTVRCGTATRDEEVLHATDIPEATLAAPKEPGRELDEKKLNNQSNSNSSEDDWVEVKVPATSLHDNGNNFVSSSSNLNMRKISQDLYEATAEINDADPCMSITLRLLSLQNKSCVYVDEVYIFGDPVDPADSESEVSQKDNSTGSSLMAMLVPTILQLSKTTGVRHLQDKLTFDTREKQESHEKPASTSASAGNEVLLKGKSGLLDQQELKSREALEGAPRPGQLEMLPEIQLERKSRLADQQEVRAHEAFGTAARPSQVEIPAQISDPGNSSCIDIEGALSQLVSRVSRIEDLLLRFEDHMLKPITSIDERLQRVELQLEELNKETQKSRLMSSTMISSPDLSNHGSDENDYFKFGSFKSDKTEFSSSMPTDDTPERDSANSIPSLVVTAPEFVNADDEDENHAFATAVDATGDKPKQALSIDDALASALAGFLSSTSVEPQKYTLALAVKAPEFSVEEDGISDRKSFLEFQCEVTSDPSICFHGANGTECVSDSVSTSSGTSMHNEVMKSDEDDCFERTNEVNEQMQKNEEGESALHGVFVGYTNDRSGQMEPGSSSYQMTEIVENREVSDRMSNISDVDNPEVHDELPRNQTADTSDSTATSEVREEESDKDILQNVLEFSYASSVDFEIPILDVKFKSPENSGTKSPLEVLLAGMSIMNGETLCAEEVDDGSQFGEQRNLIQAEDLEGPQTDSQLSVDVDYCNLSHKLPDYSVMNKETSTVSLI